MNRNVGCIGYGVLGFSVLLLLTVFPGTTLLLEGLYRFLIGWILFLWRVWPAMTWNLDAVGTVVVLIAGSLAVMQWLGRRFTPRWRWTWTVATVMAPCWLFVVTVGTSGVVFATREFVALRSRVYDSSRAYDIMMLSEAKGLAVAVKIADREMPTLWQTFHEEMPAEHIARLFSRYRVFVLPDADGKASRVILMHRDAVQGSKRRRIAVTASDGSARLHPEKDLPAILTELPSPTR